MRASIWSALLLGLVCSAIAAPANAQFIIDHESSGKRLRGLHGPASPAIRRSFESDREASSTFREILAATGIPGVADRIHVRASAETANAEAQVGEDGQRYIFYNSTFMRELGAKTRQYWALVFVIAHEVGHHIAGHLDFAGQNHRVELEADRYAGFILGRMGATHEEAISAVGAIGSGAASATHPPRDQRIQIVSLGWNDGSGGRPPRAVSAPPEPLTPPPPAVVAPPTAPSAPSAGRSGTYAYRVSTRLLGSTITITPQANVDTCRKSCDDTVGCVGYQFGGPPPLSKSCELFDQVTGRAIDTNWRSGLREDLARSVSVAPGLTSGPATAPTPAPTPPAAAPPPTPRQAPLALTKPLTPPAAPPPPAVVPPPVMAPKSVDAPFRFGYKTRTHAGVVGDQIRETPVDSQLACLLLCLNTPQCTAAAFSGTGKGQCRIFGEGARITSDQPGAVTAIFKE